jgi:hypothetical protein
MLRVTTIFIALMLTYSETRLVASQTPSPYSEIEHKGTITKRVRSDATPETQSSVQQTSTSESAQLTTLQKLKQESEKEKYSRRAQLKALLYEMLEELPIDLICLITAYDSHVLTGKLQCTFSTAVPSTTVASIAALTSSANDNIFYAQTSDGVTYWCNATTGESAHAIMQAEKKPKLRTDLFPEAPKLVRSHALLSQAIELSDGTIAQSQGKEIIILTLESNNKTTIIRRFKAIDLITQLLALRDGRLVTGLFNGQVHIWV